ncbi:MAG: LytR/AlgR family response regulator transcription factor [Flavobacteriales bacterium]
MRVLLIEDEHLAMRRLKKMLLESMPEAQILAELDSVESSVHWLKSNPDPEVIFTDVQLADGTCFDIFNSHSTKAKIIFITAYNEYALDAFKISAADYLLKPLKDEDFQRTISRLLEHRKSSLSNIDYERLAQAILQEENKFNRRYLIRFGEQVRTVQSHEIAYIYTTLKAVFLVLPTGKEYPIDKTLDQLEKELDPSKFFRINRQFIVSTSCIGNMHVVSKSRIQIDLIPAFKGDDVIVSTEKSPLFKIWLGG